MRKSSVFQAASFGANPFKGGFWCKYASFIKGYSWQLGQHLFFLIDWPRIDLMSGQNKLESGPFGAFFTCTTKAVSN